MCIDIATDSVIEKHLLKKIHNTIDEGHEYIGGGEYEDYSYSKIVGESYGNQVINGSHKGHDLTMLDSFHISLGKPPEGIEPQILPLEIYQPGPELAVGYITLSDIKISEKENKKSAWIDVKDLTWAILDRRVETCFVQEGSDQWVLAKYESMAMRNETSMPLAYGQWPTWHISLANLTGKRRDSISRPEDCIIDTITA